VALSYGAWQLWAWRTTRAPVALAVAGAAALVASLLGLYLRRLMKRGIGGGGKTSLGPA
jgi:hypothetical protein